jgi:mercuric ion binding protein
MALTLGAAGVAASQESKSVTLSIPRMYCTGCEQTVKKALKSVPGVGDVNVDLERKIAVVQFDGTKAGESDLVRATTKAGFPASVKP